MSVNKPLRTILDAFELIRCIDKSSAELPEAIDSIYRWYQKAKQLLCLDLKTLPSGKAELPKL